MPQSRDDGAASDVSTTGEVRIDQYRVEHLIGRGHASVVYFATDDRQRGLAVKVLDPDRVQRPFFQEHLEADLRAISRLAHPRILPVYRFGIEEHGRVFVAMAFAPSGTLQKLLSSGTLTLAEAQPVLEAVADALQGAHAVGVVHHDVKPSNVLFDASGRAYLGDFGVPRTSYGLLGTPGYIAPEELLGLNPDRRVDVHALGVVAFEMLTGTSPYVRATPTETILATVQEPVPSASRLNQRLPAEVDLVLARAMAKMPEERYPTAVEFVTDLAHVMSGSEPKRVWESLFHPSWAAPEEATPSASTRKDQFEQSVAKLEEVLKLALTASVMVDQNSFIVGWNGLAERTFGWSMDEIHGRSLVTTMIPPKYRELHERGLSKYLETGEGPVLGQKLELSALHKDGREFPVELSITEAVRSGNSARILAFVRDISQERLSQRMEAVRAALAPAIEEAGTLQAAASRVLGTIAKELDWAVGMLWLSDSQGTALRLEGTWHSDEIDSARLEEAARAAEYARGDGVPGRAWARGEPVWFEDLLSGEDTPRAVAALRAGLRTVAALPILQAGAARGVVELFATTARREDRLLMNSLYELGRQLGGLSAGSLPHNASELAPAVGQRAQFELSVEKLQEVLNLALTASVMVDHNSYIVGWNGLAEQTFGWSRDEILGRSLVTTLIPPQYREAHERGLSRYLETGEGPVLGQKLELSALHKDGREFPVELSITEAVRSEHSARILAFLRDISEERLLRRTQAVRSALAQAIDEAGTLRGAAPGILETIGKELDWSVAMLWLTDSERNVLRLAETWYAEGLESGRLAKATRAAEFGKGDGVPGSVWATGEPVWFEDLLSGEDTPRAVAALRAGLRTVAALPIVQTGEVRGVVELYASTARREDPLMLNSFYDLGRQIGRAPLASTETQ
jgi:PAS domain S-box-containing protein